MEEKQRSPTGREIKERRPTNGFVDPVTITTTIERELRDEIQAWCNERDVTFRSFVRRAVQLLHRRVKGR